MKKIVATVVSVLMMLASVPFMDIAYASGTYDTPTVVAEGPDTCLCGDDIQVSVSLQNITDYCAVKFYLVYDTENYEFLSVSGGSDFAKKGTLTINENASGQRIFVSLASAASLSVEGTLVTAQFHVKGNTPAETTFSLDELDVSDSNSDTILTDALDAVVTIAPFPSATLVLEPISDEDNTLFFGVNLENAENYCGLRFTLHYDADAYAVIEGSASMSEDFSKGTCFSINPKYSDSEIFLSVVFAEPSRKNGQVMTLSFVKTTENEAQPFYLSDIKLIDETSSPIQICGVQKTFLIANYGIAVLNTGADDTFRAVCPFFNEDGKMVFVKVCSEEIAAGTIGICSFESNEHWDNSDAQRKVIITRSGFEPVAETFIPEEEVSPSSILSGEL